MIRKTLTILSLIGLLLSGGLWGVSYMKIGYADGDLYVLLFEGGLECEYIPGSGEVGVSEWLHFGFHDFRTRWDYQSDFTCLRWGINLWTVFIPLWIPTAVFGVLFISCRSFHFYHRHKRRRLSLCVKCGYDLRGSKEQCPECGTALETP